ncbi:hypothetical protein NDU88_008459 [Pleurodeles waltl]|uniref:Uncharacterized protein n=1 Tax=Pleurodeles waltl TaxID=8319 RepID=A0AAV7RUP8_PLEWA|nr:hypothetical protein NDU88_008459 [Pleurodeles waltl]
MSGACILRKGRRDKQPLLSLFMNGLLGGSASPSPSGFCPACHLRPLWAVSYMLQPIWTAGPGDPATPKLCPAFRRAIVVSERKTN